MNFSDILTQIWKWRSTSFVAFITIITIVGFVYTVSKRQYTSEAVLVVGQDARGIKDESSSITSALSSLAQIALTTNVIKDSTEKVGLKKILPNFNYDDNVLKKSFRRLAEAVGLSSYVPKHDNRQSWPRIAEAIRPTLKVKAEDKSNVLTISFRNEDPEIAAEFVNALCASLIKTQSELMSRSSVVTIFDKRMEDLEYNAKVSATNLAQYMSKNSTYSIETQRDLLLKRASELSASLGTSRTSIADRQGQKQTLVDQLRRLKPVSQSPFVSGLVESLGGNVKSDADERSRRPIIDERSTTGDPPLLLVRVYQDGMANLLKINSELTGLENLEVAQLKELNTVNTSLSELSKKQTEFDRLMRAVSLSANDVEIYRKRMLDEQVSADLLASRVASLRVVQEGVAILDPSYPRLSIFLPLGLLAALMGAVVAALGRELNERRGSNIVKNPGPLSTLQAVPASSARKPSFL